MISLQNTFQFKYTWRSYQRRFLEGFATHFEDHHLHVVAPPGSGKTVLGLEMIRRVDQKTIVFAPTLTIRNQWEERMYECFVAKDMCDIPLSRNIKQPAHITFSTYQSLHAFFKNEMEGDGEKLVTFFAKAGIKNIVLDEAHHLKNEWWKPLFALKALPDCSLIALTATPPYDSEQREIAKYFELCGPIDVEIGVPELVKEGNLCPHQDYIHFSQPDEAQVQYIIAYRMKLMTFINELIADVDFKNFILQHPFYIQTTQVLEDIYDNSDLYAAMLIYLNATKAVIPVEKLAVLGVENKKTVIPDFTYTWVTSLLQPLLVEHREALFEHEALLNRIEKELRKIGAFHKKRVHLEGKNELYKSLAQSPNKLKSIQEIIAFESAQLKTDLRAVVLADYIRKEFLDTPEEQLDTINKLGVIPIFNYLKASLKRDPEKWQAINRQEKLAVLTGSLIIIHDRLRSHIDAEIPSDYYTVSPMGDTDFLLLTPKEKGKNQIVRVMTSLFSKGHIEVLIGTTSLLGEGWDAPAINTLVLASYVGSFVMSNQMRGRAIRVHTKDPDKVASVWHLACIDPTVPDGGEDVDKLYKRFEAFCGVSLSGTPFIENGVDRFSIPKEHLDKNHLNTHMFSLAAQRQEVRHRWNIAIAKGNILVRELKLNLDNLKDRRGQKKVYYKDVVKYTIIELVTLVTFTLPELFFKNLGAFFSRGVLYFFYAILSGLALLFLPKTYKAIVLYIKYGRIDKQLHKIGQVLLKTMRDKHQITTPVSEIQLRIEKFDTGEVSCFIRGATAKEELLFVNNLEEIVKNIDNPRYMIAQSRWLQRTFGFSNYFAVPAAFAERKQDALLFFKYWKIYKGPATLIFTRNPKGRKQLLKARFHYLNTEGGFKTKTATIWK
ncbi:DEAD/DEAH box helicase family protein [uncultured Dokdonia sp.]|uniref:DEAD/DEAH box helicase family protein n=1 Tax=uncultured Dokdonia sp. TaxID=575653 RepID=UPI0026288A86|nr:DEAD/DEAH box helicase family protein [uncultured Dokdonia sp.]